MRTRTTLILLALAALILGALMQGDRFFPSTRDRDAKRANPMGFESEKIDSIEIESAEGTVQLKVVDHLWHIIKPFDDMADPDRVTALLESLQKAEWLEHLERSDLSGDVWKASGLDKPTATVRLLSAGKTAAECRIGQPSAIDGACYVDVPGLGKDKREVFVAQTDVLTVLKKPVEAWRDDRLLRVPAESVSRLVLDAGHGQIEMVRSKPKAPWDLVKPLQTHGHNERINEILSAILSLKITAISQADGLKNSTPTDALKITVQTPAFKDPVELILATPPDIKAGKTQATASHRGQSFTITSERLYQLWVQLNDLRDDHLARVDANKIDAVAVKSAQLGEVLLHKEQDYWTVERNNQREPANGERITKLFETLNEHRVKEFVADSSANLEPYGLKEPFLTVAWSEAATTPTAPPAANNKTFESTPEINTETVLTFGQDKTGNVFAKYENEPFVYRVGASVLAAVPRDNVRWKALNPVRFSQFALRKIALTVGTKPSMVVDYNPVTAEWKAELAGKDVTPQLDRVKADRLAGKLGGIIVDDWVQDRSGPVLLLQTPAITVQITLLTEAGNLKSPTKLLTLNFSPTIAGQDTAIYYGRVDNEPDIFTLSRSALMDIIGKPLWKDE